MKSRFQLDEGSAPTPTPTLIDPEAFDVSEQQFAASLEQNSIQAPARFVPEYAERTASSPVADDNLTGIPKNNEADNGPPAQVAAGSDREDVLQGATVGSAADPSSPPGPDLWRREVAARVNHYRGKRPRVPRYPSLQLKFDSPEPSRAAQPIINQPEVTSRGQLAITMDLDPAPVMDLQAGQSVQDFPNDATPDSGKILEFPRSSFTPPMVVDELAEPVFDRPRILEAPEVLPPPPALGGILIESMEVPKDDRRPGFELPLKSAPLSRRILAGLTDALVVTTAFAAFAYIFFRMTSIVPPLRQGISVAAPLLAVFWAAYQYLLLVHAGSTPGLKLAKLELSRFDGTPVPRRLRRWRVLASVLSGLSLALGYVWCFMDEDELCWHDRITHTYMAPRPGKSMPKPTADGCPPS